MKATPTIMVIAGEISGDMHAAGVVAAIRRQRPDTVFFGIGGEHMRREGVELLHHTREMAVMGLWEVLHRLSFFRSVFAEMRRVVRERRPDAVILVDYPGFNLRFARALHGTGPRIIYYVCPQVWAWNRSRIPRMAKVIDRLITIFPFEAAHFEGTGLRVDFAGHPLVDECREALAAPQGPLPWKGEPRIAILPGSRSHVIDHVLPTLWETARLIEAAHPGASFILPAPNEEGARLLESRIATLRRGPTRWAVVAGNTRDVLRQARAAVVTSGTATIETALMDCPMIIAYKLNPFSYLLGRLLVKVDYIGMVNIIANRRLCPEFIQGAATPSALAAALDPLIGDTPARTAMLTGLREVRQALGNGGAAEAAASVVLSELPA